MSAPGARLFEGERALVTGAASGIGRAIAAALEAEGASVLRTDLAGEGKQFIAADLSVKDEYKKLLAHTESVSIFVHSACPRRHEADAAMAVDRDTWDAMLEVNLASGFFLAREIGRAMREKGIRGRMLFLTSLHAHTPRNLPHYAASKAGMTMIVKELARALGPAGIRVNALAPGAVPGGGFAGDFTALAKKIPLGRVGNPDEIAQSALALLSNRFSAYVTGTTLAVDGGLALHSWIEPPS